MTLLLPRSSYADLPERFFARVSPTPVAQPTLLGFNQALASDLGLDAGGLDAQNLAAIFSGNQLLPGSDPIAMAYAGHQFGHFVPQLGDGRAILLGESPDRRGVRRDIQLKGSGRTPYSRGGDGRSALGPVLREYLVSEAMHALGIAGTRALAAVSTGEFVYREEPLPGAILTRVAASLVRVGTFQFFAAQEDGDACRVLADYVIERHYRDLKDDAQPYLALLRAVTDAQASLVARWMGVGFIHGVMNTDNMAVSGETIDYGPCAFMDAYDPATVFSSIDRLGRYAYANQPRAAVWNLARFAETLLRFIDPLPERAIELATGVIDTFPAVFAEYRLAEFRRKLGLADARDGDAELIDDLLAAMHASQADFTVTFRRLCEAVVDDAAALQVRRLFPDPGLYDAWAARWKARLVTDSMDASRRRDSMKLANPAVIPRNHRIAEVIAAAQTDGNFGPFTDLSNALADPYRSQERFAAYEQPPLPGERVLQTFCGT